MRTKPLVVTYILFLWVWIKVLLDSVACYRDVTHALEHVRCHKLIDTFIPVLVVLSSLQPATQVIHSLSSVVNKYGFTKPTPTLAFIGRTYTCYIIYTWILQIRWLYLVNQQSDKRHVTMLINRVCLIIFNWEHNELKYVLIE